jgi:hypothetical protein
MNCLAPGKCSGWVFGEISMEKLRKAVIKPVPEPDALLRDRFW